MITPRKSFDFFISYATPDFSYAETLGNQLHMCRVFLAPRSLLPGEDWPARLVEVIRDAWVTLALISRHTSAAHFQREEILLAVQENRSGFHTVVPIRLVVDGETPPLPIGLNSKNCVDLYSGSGDAVGAVVDGLLAARDDIRSRAGLGWRTADSDPLRDALERVAAYNDSGLLLPSAVERIQLILLRHHLIGR